MVHDYPGRPGRATSALSCAAMHGKFQAMRAAAKERKPINEIVAALWSEQEHAGRTGPPPTWAEVVAFDPPESVRLESARLMNAFMSLRGVREYRRLIAIEAPGDVVFDVAQRGTGRNGCTGARVAVPIQEMRERYNESADRDDFPLTPVLLAYPRLPVSIRESSILPAGLGHVQPHDRRAAGQLFSVAPPRLVDPHGQLEIPGFAAAYQSTRTVALPPSLWGLGQLPTGGGRGEALATRLWVAAVRLVRSEDWDVEGAPLAVSDARDPRAAVPAQRRDDRAPPLPE